MLPLWESLKRASSLALIALSACVSPPPLVESVPPLPQHERPQRPQGHIIACGERFAVDAPVVLWTEAPYYDATSTTHRFNPKAGRVLAEEGPRLVLGRKERDGAPTLQPNSGDLALLRDDGPHLRLWCLLGCGPGGHFYSRCAYQKKQKTKRRESRLEVPWQLMTQSCK